MIHASNNSGRHGLTRRHPWVLLSLIVAALMIWVATTLFRTESTLALWNGSVDTPGGRVASGDFGITVKTTDGSATFPQGVAPLYPGQTQTLDFSVANTGDATARLTGSLSSDDENGAHLSAQVAPGSCTTGAAPAQVEDSFGSLTPGATENYCLHLTLLPTAPNSLQGSPLDFTLTIDGLQEVRS